MWQAGRENSESKRPRNRFLGGGGLPTSLLSQRRRNILATYLGLGASQLVGCLMLEVFKLRDIFM